MTSETNGQTDLSTPAKRKANITLLSFLLGDQTHLTPAQLGDGDNLGEPLPWLSRPGPRKIQVFMQPLVSKKRKRRKLLRLNTDDNLFLIELVGFFLSAWVVTHVQGPYFGIPQQRIAHISPAPTTALPNVGWWYFSLSPSQTPAIKPCCD